MTQQVGAGLSALFCGVVVSTLARKAGDAGSNPASSDFYERPDKLLKIVSVFLKKNTMFIGSQISISSITNDKAFHMIPSLPVGSSISIGLACLIIVTL